MLLVGISSVAPAQPAETPRAEPVGDESAASNDAVRRTADGAIEIELDALPQGSFPQLYRESLIAFNQGNFEQAAQLATKAYNIKSDDQRLLVLLGKVAVKLGQNEQAYKFLKKANEVSPNSAEVAMVLGQAYFADREFAKAASAFKASLALKPQNLDATLLLLYSHVGEGDLPAANKALNDLNPDDNFHPGYSFGKAAIERATGRAGEARLRLNSIQTNYGIETYANYLATYEMLFAQPKPVNTSATASQ